MSGVSLHLHIGKTLLAYLMWDFGITYKEVSSSSNFKTKLIETKFVTFKTIFLSFSIPDL